MPDLVTCKAVLVKRQHGSTLYLECAPDFHLRVIPVRPKGTAKPSRDEPNWEYEERGDRLHLTPSLRCLDTEFHTAYAWDCAFELCPDGDGYGHFYRLNPAHKPSEED